MFLSILIQKVDECEWEEEKIRDQRWKIVEKEGARGEKERDKDGQKEEEESRQKVNKNRKIK